MSDQARAWQRQALACLEQEAARSADTHLLRVDPPAFPDITLYLKDEAAHPTGSLKHRLARSLYLFALCNGRLNAGQTVIDASSGSTAISEAWFARLLGLNFVAVMPKTTAPAKIEAIRTLGARCDLVDAGVDCAAHARQWALQYDACYLDQFGLAERATDWRGNNNIAESILLQMVREAHPVPAWIVCGAGTGGTSATIGRSVRYRQLATQVCVAEPVGAAFANGWNSRDRAARASQPTLIEGIGRPQVEPGFIFEVVDAVEEVEDADSIAAAWLLEQRLGRRYGGSSGTNLIACMRIATRMRERSEQGSIVSLLCDCGERYASSLFDADWLAARGIDIAARLELLRRWVETAA